MVSAEGIHRGLTSARNERRDVPRLGLRLEAASLGDIDQRLQLADYHLQMLMGH